MASKLIQLPSRQEMWWRLLLVSSNSHLQKTFYIEVTGRCANHTLTPNGLIQRFMDSLDSYEYQGRGWIPSVLLAEQLPQYIAVILDDPRNRVEALEALRAYQRPRPAVANPQREAQERKRAERAARRKPRGRGRYRKQTSLEESARSKRLDDEMNNEGNGPRSDS